MAAEVTEKDYEIRADFLSYQIMEADKKLEKARKELRNRFQHKKKLMETLEKLESNLDK